MREENLRKKTAFGVLLTEYREDQWLSQTGLQRRLKAQGYHVTTATINNYEWGRRQPSADFVFAVVRALRLNELQEDALVEACVADVITRFITQYRELREENE